MLKKLLIIIAVFVLLGLIRGIIKQSYENSQEKSYISTEVIKSDKIDAVIPPKATEAESQIIQKAENGDAAAQADLGAMYLIGTNSIRQDYTEAFKWLNEAAKKDYAPAQQLLGMMYTEGHGVSQDHNKAAEWLTRAAEQGLAQAQLLLGTMYLAGQGITQDFIVAVELITKSADQGYAPAQFFLGRMYDNGEIVPKNPNEAFKWYHKAAGQGWPPAQYDLGLMCAERQDYVEAYKWLLLAQKNGEDVSESMLIIQNILSPDQVIEAQRRAETFVEHKSSIPFTSDTVKGFYEGIKSLR